MTDSEISWPSRTRAWFWVLVLLLAYMCAYIDRQIVSLMVDRIKSDLNITDTQFGLLTGLSFTLLYSIAALPIGSLVDRYQRRVIISSGVLLWSVMTALCGTANQFWTLFLARVGVGVGEATVSPTAYSLLSDCFPRNRLGRALSVFVAGGGIGIGLAFLVGSVLIGLIDSYGFDTLPGIGHVRSWQMVFFLVALPGLPIAALIILLREPARQGRVHAEAPPWSNVLAFVRSRARLIVNFILGMACVLTVTLSTLSWAAAFLMRTHAQSLSSVGLQLGMASMSAIIGGLIAGAWLNERLERRGRPNAAIRIARIGILLTIPAAVSMALATKPSVALACIFFVVFFANMPYGVAAAALQSLTPNELRGRIAALYLFILNAIATILGPLIPALFTDHLFGGDKTKVGVSLAMTISIAAVCGAALLTLALRGATTVGTAEAIAKRGVGRTNQSTAT